MSSVRTVQTRFGYLLHLARYGEPGYPWEFLRTFCGKPVCDGVAIEWDDVAEAEKCKVCNSSPKRESK